ncbi:hypothetical protein [Parasitella parasitica]|uniref:Uncharacterized protein n=1 Tax=Parasitella parasitica TaxID=35722 RepID=A0A0B7N1D4_9FUNG|nr:hypothetical protein [Parasitella parasitica]
MRNTIEAQITSGDNMGKLVYIHTYLGSHYILKKTLYVNDRWPDRAQGQTFNKVFVNLVFAHGQLYIALSVSARANST